MPSEVDGSDSPFHTTIPLCISFLIEVIVSSSMEKLKCLLFLACLTKDVKFSTSLNIYLWDFFRIIYIVCNSVDKTFTLDVYLNVLYFHQVGMLGGCHDLDNSEPGPPCYRTLIAMFVRLIVVFIVYRIRRTAIHACSDHLIVINTIGGITSVHHRQRHNAIHSQNTSKTHIQKFGNDLDLWRVY